MVTSTACNREALAIKLQVVLAAIKLQVQLAAIKLQVRLVVLTTNRRYG